MHRGMDGTKRPGRTTAQPTLSSVLIIPSQEYSGVISMGTSWSKESLTSIDGLGNEFPLRKEHTHHSRESSHERLEQLLRAYVTSTVTSARPDIGPTCVAAYYLGATPHQLLHLYEHMAGHAPAWPKDNPIADSIGFDTLRDYMDQPQYESRFFEYFRDCLTESSDWPDVVLHHMSIIVPRLRGTGKWEPLILLSHALEAGNALLAMAALSTACVMPETESHSDPQPTKLQEGVLRDLVMDASRSPNKYLLVAAQSISEILCRNSPRLIPNQYQTTLVAELQRDVAASLAHGREVEPEYPRNWEHAINHALHHDPNELCYLRALLFSSVI